MIEHGIAESQPDQLAREQVVGALFLAAAQRLAAGHSKEEVVMR